MASAIPRGFVRTAPSRAKKIPVDIRVTDMKAADALWWDARLGPYHAQLATRADRWWSWSALLPMAHLVQLAQRRFCRALVTWVRADNGQFVRAGMSILIQHYPYLDFRTPDDSHFMWFMSAAEADVLRRNFGVSDPPSLGRVLLDNAIVLSQNAGLSGRIGLHAAAAGGPGLLAFYVKCGLLNLPSAAPLPAAVRRQNDGRFFYADDVVAAALATALDPNR
ncbi:MAG TPA: hypothetical protein VJQ59_08420 [Candidatus Sulfotelmatobacter sp.]|nr:hypothetical protein [Candidatus Sulfotelmatobacter sp.]